MRAWSACHVSWLRELGDALEDSEFRAGVDMGDERGVGIEDAPPRQLWFAYPGHPSAATTRISGRELAKPAMFPRIATRDGSGGAPCKQEVAG